MIVTCPSCETKFEIPDDKYRPGRKARCSNCGNVFVLPDMAGDAPPVDPASALEPPEPAPASFGADLDALLAQAEAGDRSGTEQFQEMTEAAEGEPEGDAEEEDSPETAPPASFDDVVPPPPPPAKRKFAFARPAFAKPGKKKLLLVLGIVLVVVLLGYGGVMVFSALFASPPPSTALSPEEEAARQVAVGRLALENVQQFRVENEKAGSMVVIEGAVANNFDTPKDYILLEITLYDSSGKITALREQYCGVTLTELQLRTFSRDAIESALKNEAAIVINNTNVLPGSQVYFTSVFFNVPKSAYEFEVRIIDVKDSAPNK